MEQAVLPESNVEVNQQVYTQTESKPAAESKPIVRICSHIKDDGLRCGTPALNGRQFCYYHSRAHFPGARISTRQYRAPIPESVASLQIALAHAMQALMTGEISPKQANSIMYGINLGTNLLRQSKPLTESEQQQVITEVPQPMEHVFAAGNIDAIEQPLTPLIPEERQQAIAILEQEIRSLRSKVLSTDRISLYRQHLREHKGTSDPRYYTASDRLAHHDYATEKLRKMGVPITPQ